jgi:chemotaxis-related protein WspB
LFRSVVTMLFLQFQIGPDRYALDASRVVEIIPLLDLKKIPQAPRGVAGLFNYRGEPVPALDLSELTTGRPAAERLSTRILVVRVTLEGCGSRLLGLIAERATGTLRREADDFTNSGLTPGALPYLGPVLLDDQGVIQWIQEDKLLPENLRQLLFAPAAMPAHATH